MQYHQLGGSGLQVARIGLGCIPFGSTIDEEASRLMVDRYLDAGGNYLDTANVYGGGMRGSHERDAGTSERTVGAVVAGRRNRFVIGTKGAWTMTDQVRPNGFGLSRTYLTREIEASLRRLGTDYIDLYQCHVWDPYTPIEETMRVLDDAVRAGKIRYVGVSNWAGWQVVKANMHADRHGLTPIVSNQIWYNLADRTAEFALIPGVPRPGRVDHGVGRLRAGVPDRPLHARHGPSPPPGSRITSSKPEESSSWERLAVDRVWDTQEVMRGVAARHGRSPANVAMAWLLQSGRCDVALLGAFAPEQLDDGLGALGLTLDGDDLAELDRVSRLAGAVPDELLEHLLLPRQRVLRRPALSPREAGVLFRRLVNRRQQIEVRIGVFEGGAVAAGAGGNEHIGRRSGHAPGARSPREVIRSLPDAIVDAQLGERAGEVSQDPLFLRPAGAVPQLELLKRAPTRLPAPQRGLDTAADRRVAMRTKEMYPGRRIDENHRLNPGVVQPEAPAA